MLGCPTGSPAGSGACSGPQGAGWQAAPRSCASFIYTMDCKLWNIRIVGGRLSVNLQGCILSRPHCPVDSGPRGEAQVPALCLRRGLVWKLSLCRGQHIQRGRTGVKGLPRGEKAM